eukprot:2147030-Pyramimonas_sp.AAC.1
MKERNRLRDPLAVQKFELQIIDNHPLNAGGVGGSLRPDGGGMQASFTTSRGYRSIAVVPTT